MLPAEMEMNESQKRKSSYRLETLKETKSWLPKNN